MERFSDRQPYATSSRLIVILSHLFILSILFGLFNFGSFSLIFPHSANSTGIGAVLRNSKGDVLAMFFKCVGAKYFNEVEVLAILEVLRIFKSSFQESLIMESDSSNIIHWVSLFDRSP